MIFLYIGAIIVFVYVTLGWTIVPQGHIAIIERLGAYQRELTVGIHFKLPLVDQVRQIVKITIQEKELDEISLATKDDKLLTLKTTIMFIVENPKLYVYGVKDPFETINKKIELALTNEILRINYEDLGEIIEDLNNLVLSGLKDKLLAFGIKLERVSLKKIIK